MRRVLLIGENGSGKRTLISFLAGDRFKPPRAMSLQYWGRFINTPGEFLENRRFYSALITTAADCALLFLVQDAARNSSLFPPLFCSAFNCETIGVVTKIDTDAARPERAARFLLCAGVTKVFSVSCVTGQGMDMLQANIK